MSQKLSEDDVVEVWGATFLGVPSYNADVIHHLYHPSLPTGTALMMSYCGRRMLFARPSGHGPYIKCTTCFSEPGTIKIVQ